MDIHLRKIKLAQDILDITDEQILLGIEILIKKQKVRKYEEELKPMSIKELNERINQAEKEIENGSYKTSEELLKRYH